MTAVTDHDPPAGAVRDSKLLRFAPSGDWIVAEIRAREAEIAGLALDGVERVEVDLAGVTQLDTAGAWLLYGALQRWRAAGVEITNFLGTLVSRLGALTRRPWRFRGTSVAHHLDMTGLRAVPIIALMSFLVGGIVAQQGAFQLSRFGANIFVVDLVGILVLREIGLLLTAIMVAGRSGSAFTAEIGSMKMH